MHNNLGLIIINLLTNVTRYIKSCSNYFKDSKTFEIFLGDRYCKCRNFSVIIFLSEKYPIHSHLMSKKKEPRGNLPAQS